ncbi:MAG: cellulose-binding protein [Planctomycetes bacterium]|nr:cellulose-binding protein [Planctomycetota bacterium]
MKVRLVSLVVVALVAGTGIPRRSIAQEPSPLGTNLAGVVCYSTEYPFVDAFKSSSPWVSGTEETWDDRRAIDVDLHGWVRSLLPGQIVYTSVFSRDIRYPAGRYVVEYEGEGEIRYQEGAELVERSPGRDAIEVDPSRGNLLLAIVSVNPRNYLRNIRIPLPGVEAQAGEIFNPLFLERIANYGTLRFMIWMLGDSPEQLGQETWCRRPKPEDARWSDKGVPVEVMVELANRLEADPWFNIPHQANDEYVRRFAEYVRDTLHPGLRAYVEHSNEVWNPTFSVHPYAIARGDHLATAPASDPDQHNYEAQYRYHVRRSLAIFDIFERVLGRNRLVRVLATQNGNVYLSRDMLTYEDSASHTDALATGAYFGYILGTRDLRSRVLAMQLDDLFAVLRDESLRETRQDMLADAEVAREFGLPLVAYEGGQHLACMESAERDQDVIDLFHAANRDPRMGALYDELLSDWSTASGGGLFIHCDDCERMNWGGSWGALESIEQPRSEAPKYDALERWMESSGQAPRTRTPLPDLAGSWSPVVPTRVRVGRAIRYRLQGTLLVENRGDATAGACHLRVYRSADATLDGSDVLIAEGSLCSLPPGAQKRLSLRVVLARGSNPRNHHVLAVIDDRGEVEESDEENNVAAGRVR